MKYHFILLLGMSFLILSCKSNEKGEDLSTEFMSHEDVVNLNDSSQTNADKIDYNGRFKGKVKGKEVELELADKNKNFTFTIIQSGKKLKGQVSKVDDGTIIYLIASSGNAVINYLSWEDNNTWGVMNEDGSYPEIIDDFLTRVE